MKSHRLAHPKLSYTQFVQAYRDQSTTDPVTDIQVQLEAIAKAVSDFADSVSVAVLEISLDLQALASTPQPSPSPQPQPSPSGIMWPTFTGIAQSMGVSPSGRVAVYLDAGLASNADAVKNAADLIADADRVCSLNDQIFGVTGGSVNVLLFAMSGATDGTGGADHLACTFADGGNIEVCLSYGSSARCSALFEAEYSECAMNGQLCGLSTGEALSRWCAMEASGNALSDFSTAPAWQSDGSANFVDAVDQTDTNPDSIGCGMAFISYLIHRGATLPQIAQEMVALGDGGTLADLYAAIKMGRAADAWPTFSAAAAALGAIASDDPFAQIALAMKKNHEHI